MKIIKKNQIVIFVIALMLVTAGYLNFIETNTKQVNKNDDSLGDATLVNANVLVENEGKLNMEEARMEEVNQEGQKQEETIAEAISSEKELSKTSKKDTDIQKESNTDEYFTSSKLERDNMYSQIIESYQKMINGETITAEQKAIAQNEITKINNTKNAIMITENLIKTKGIDDVVILVNENSINVIISGENMKQDQIAQVQNIVSREMKAEIENIHISNK